MIFQVNQTKAAGSNEFEVVCGDRVIYRGTASWFPVGLDKTNKVTLTDPDGNLDKYCFHLLPACDELLPLMAMYVIFFDFMHHNHSGQFYKGYKMNVSYTYDVHQKKYQKDFILNNFGEAENERMKAFTMSDRKNPERKKFWLIFIGIWILVLGLIALGFLIIGLLDVPFTETRTSTGSIRAAAEWLSLPRFLL